jgi:ribose/xylose/arabinose/galactoside ABC-type transport system permease subunit
LIVLRRWGLLFVLLVVFALFYAFVPSFRSINNLVNIVRSATITGIFAIGLTFIVNSGEFDLSFPAVGSMSVIIGAMYFLSNGVSLIASYSACMIIGTFLGTMNGILVVYIGIPAFIATLGMYTLLTGLTGYVTGGGLFFDSKWPGNLKFLGRDFIAEIPVPVIVFLIISIIAILYIEHTRVGKHVLAVGGNEIAAKNMGIKTKKVKLSTYIISGFLGAIAGIVTWSMLGTVSHTMTRGYQMPVISAVFLGAIFLRDGIANIYGTIIASILLALVANGLTMLGAQFFFRDITQGVILVIAISLLAILKRKELGN